MAMLYFLLLAGVLLDLTTQIPPDYPTYFSKLQFWLTKITLWDVEVRYRWRSYNAIQKVLSKKQVASPHLEEDLNRFPFKETCLL